MNNPLSISTRPGSSSFARGKHIGKLPIIMAGTLGVLLVGGIIFGAANRMNRNEDANTQPSTNLKDDGETVEPAQPFVISTNDGEEIFNEEDYEYESDTITPTIVDQGVVPIIRDENLAEFQRRQKLEDLKARDAGLLSVSKITFNTTNTGEEMAMTSTAKRPEEGLRPVRNDGSSLSPDLLRQLRGSRATNSVDSNNQLGKIDFMNTEKPSGYLPNTVIQPLSKFEVKTGTVIPGLLLTDLNSDLPGMILGQVRTNVYDSATGQHVLIPQGSRLIGEYDSKVSYGQNRALVAWRRIIFPTGAALDLAAMSGADSSGASGFKDKVNKHYARLFGGIFGLSVFQSIPSLINSDSTTSSGTSSDLEKILATNLSKTGEKLTEKNLGIQPTIEIRAGYRFNVIVNKDILFPGAYHRG